jgi:CRISPR-associated protein Cmr6
VDCRRNVLSSVEVSSGTHLGLWLDRGLAEQPGINANGGAERAPFEAATRKLFDEVLTITAQSPAGYYEHVKRIQKAAKDLGGVTTFATVQGRMIVGMGAKNALEFGIHLDRTWGVPVIPGSSLKGIAAAAAQAFAEQVEWRKTKISKDKWRSEPLNAWLFGCGADAEEANRGAVHFWDAWWVPDNDRSKIPVHRDVMTVHHPDYYQKGDAAPSDMDEPRPIPFLSASGTYLIVAEGETEWREAALEFLKKGLLELGVGAKTNAGYGRLTIDWVPPLRTQPTTVPENSQIEQEPAAKALTGTTLEEVQQKLDRFKLNCQRASDADRTKVVMTEFGGLGDFKIAAAQWYLDTYFGGDFATANKKGSGKAWWKPLYDVLRK